MTKNPLINGLTASTYIVLLVAFINYGMKLVNGPNATYSSTREAFMPIVMISVFTFSAALMGYVFGYQPFQLYFEGKKKEAVKLFLQTTAVFGAVTLLLAITVFSGLLR